MKNLALAVLLALCSVALSSCGADDGESPIDNQCTLFVIPPQSGVVGESVEVRVSYELNVGSGVPDLSFAIDRSGSPVTFSTVDEAGLRISFVPTEPGPHRVVVSGSVGFTNCPSETAIINIADSSALRQEYILRVVPEEGPAQEQRVTVLGGTEVVFPDLSLQPGIAISSQVMSQDAGVPGYVRATSLGNETLFAEHSEGFADDFGDFVMQVPQGQLDLLFVPADPNLPSRTFTGLSTGQFPTQLQLPAFEELGGILLDDAGQPISAASVVLEIDGAPSTSAPTDAQGLFQVRAYAGALTGVFVVPPSGSGLPFLRATNLMGQSVASNTPVQLRYTMDSDDAHFVVRDPQGALVANASVELRSDFAAAGSVEVSMVEELAGQIRVSGNSDGIGELTLRLPVSQEPYSILAQNQNQGVVSEVVIDAGQDTNLQLQERIATALFFEKGGAPLEGANVQLQPVGILNPTSAGESQRSDSSGRVEFSSLVGGEYHLRVQNKSQRFGPLVFSDVASPIELPATVKASGRVLSGGVPVTNASVSLHCATCDGELATEPRALGATNDTGRFQLVVEDPGQE